MYSHGPPTVYIGRTPNSLRFQKSAYEFISNDIEDDEMELLDICVINAVSKKLSQRTR